MTSTNSPGRPRLLIGLVCVLLGWHPAYVVAAAYPADMAAILIRFGLWGIAVVVVVALPFIAWRRRASPLAAIAVVLVLLLAAQWRWGTEVGLRGRFAILRARLASDVSDVRKGFDAGYWRRFGGVRIEKGLDGRPGPIAFVDGGLLDNWGGFVHAPDGVVGSTGEPVASLAQAARNHPIPAPVRNWFGGKMTYAIPLGDGWYYCWFT